MTEESSSEVTYRVVTNAEEQYSIWPTGRENPAGWHCEGMSGTKAACLAYIDAMWTDMRPASVRRRMEHAPDVAPANEVAHAETADDLVARLCNGQQPVVVKTHPAGPSALQTAVESGFIHLEFPHTRGGTRLGIRLTSECKASLMRGAVGRIHLEGSLVLNFMALKCVADVDVDTLKGTAHLVRINS